MSRSAAEAAKAPQAMVGELVDRYLKLRGRSKRSLCRTLGVDTGKLYALIHGRTYGGLRYLGIQTRGQVEVPFLRRVADELEIPAPELMEAVAIDLGIVGAQFPPPYLSEESNDENLPANVRLLEPREQRARRRWLHAARDRRLARLPETSVR